MALIHNESGNIELQATVDNLEQRVHRLEKDVFGYGKSSGDDKDAGDWTQSSDPTLSRPVENLPTQAEADAAAQPDLEPMGEVNRGF